MIFLSIDLGKLEGGYGCPVANFRTIGSPKMQFIPLWTGLIRLKYLGKFAPTKLNLIQL
jgi:hypothetical protein